MLRASQRRHGDRRREPHPVRPHRNAREGGGRQHKGLRAVLLRAGQVRRDRRGAVQTGVLLYRVTHQVDSQAFIDIKTQSINPF